MASLKEKSEEAIPEEEKKESSNYFDIYGPQVLFLSLAFKFLCTEYIDFL